jgi:hypothetical protein
MTRQIIIHAGQHKTGSTSIQTYIELHRDFLSARGITPCRDWSEDLTEERMAELPFNAKFIANAVLRQSLLTPVRLQTGATSMSDAEWELAARRINARLHATAGNTLLVSAEAFSFLRQPAEARRLDMLCDGFERRCLIFLREPKSWLDSWKVQITHSDLVSKPGAKAGEGIFDLGPSSWLVDHDAIRAFWGENAIYLSYEGEVARHGSVIPAFLAALGLDPAACPSWEGLHLNAGVKKRHEIAQRSG